MTNSAITEGIRVLTAESEALKKLADGLDQKFADAVEKLKSVKGRITVTGMGKSGHIARKIAATLASTGSPAQFVHPAEASHGDMGMITANDAVLALSNSGDTQELINLITYTRRFNIPLIGITSGKNSGLAQHADIALLLPKLPEACPLELAPMTSTTLMLGLGDALAAALMAARGFTAEQFNHYHPGGKLGLKLMKVSDLMHPQNELPLCAVDTPMGNVVVLMSEKGFGCVGITKKDKLVGIITDGDLRRHMRDDLMRVAAEKIMTANPKTISPDALVAEALSTMQQRNITSLFAVNADNVPLGIIHIHDLLRAGIA
ncbi:MAG TPA: KpsF/GutQ family sugar-phosphate isomerase [Alphaproteobacteria bacterium]|nr:KpsF/GutQ family sugar-phosphate isomerase [Rhodospirillaceae bacterium]HRJ11705.1 KpsF/GutQ family sugar-phosphate isomerase [Alphaproteobacteria bacterium]